MAEENFRFLNKSPICFALFTIISLEMRIKMEEFKVKDRELMYKGKIIDFYKDTIQLPDGREAIWDYIDQAILVKDEVTYELITKRLSKDDCKNGYIIDGFPNLSFLINQWFLLR